MNRLRRAAEVRRPNDGLRQHGRSDKIVMTNGVAALGVAEVDAIFAAVQAFGDFTPDNDPFEEHYCAVQTVGAHRIIWKIDYYDQSRRYGSPDPADPRVTFRVLTVMLAEEH